MLEKFAESSSFIYDSSDFVAHFAFATLSVSFFMFSCKSDLLTRFLCSFFSASIEELWSRNFPLIFSKE